MNNSSESDWERVDRLADDQIDVTETPPLDDRFFARAQVRLPADKPAVAVSVEPEVLAWYQSQGPDVQQRMAAALRIYAEAHRQ